jgi:hypothetical protein
MHSTSSATVENYFREIALTPLNHTELLPTLLPLILGAIVIELYFGKHTQEELGWNTAVGNAIIWITTGITLLMTTPLSPGERTATYALIGAGGFVAYMDFFHEWSSQLAFRISSSAIVYTLAYVLVVMVKTSIPVTETSLKAAGAFVIASNIGFKILQMMETPANDRMEFRTP